MCQQDFSYKYMNKELAFIIGNNIKRLREERNWSQKDLAKKSGGSFQQISKYERGENAPGSTKLNVFAEIFKVEVSELTKKYDVTGICSGPEKPAGSPALPPDVQEMVDFYMQFAPEVRKRMIEEDKERRIEELRKKKQG